MLPVSVSDDHCIRRENRRGSACSPMEAPVVTLVFHRDLGNLVPDEPAASSCIVLDKAGHRHSTQDNAHPGYGAWRGPRNHPVSSPAQLYTSSASFSLIREDRFISAAYCRSTQVAMHTCGEITRLVLCRGRRFYLETAFDPYPRRF